MFARVRALLTPSPLTAEESLLREWRETRAHALNTADEMEIDLIFARALEELDTASPLTEARAA